jgi:hypothetical protein
MSVPAPSDTPAAGPKLTADPPESCGDDSPVTRRLSEGDFGPPRRVHMIANWSSVSPGSAVRVVAKMTDPTGNLLTTDLTAFGSQSYYRLGCIRRQESRYKLFTAVAQHGERLLVTAGLSGAFSSQVTGSIELASGETGTIRLPNGMQVTVTPLLRAETAAEQAEAKRIGRPLISVLRIPQDT